jgi:hypothetical protein
MNRRVVLSALVALPLAVAGWVSAKAFTQDSPDRSQQTEAATYTCPITGEELPCPNCCPLNQSK